MAISTTFLAASLVLAVTPGPGVLYIVTQSATHGRRHGLATVAGVAAGNLASALATGVGLATLLANSSLAFSIVKYAGAAYLVYLGIRTWRAGPVTPARTEQAARPTGAFWQGAFVALLNPKTAIFFAAFLPQFMSATGNPWMQGALLGGAFVAVAAVSDAAYALLAGSLYRRMTRSPAASRMAGRVAAVVLIALGLFAALAGGRTPPTA